MAKAAKGKRTLVKESSLTREFSAGGAVFRQKVSKAEWLIIKPAGTERWQLPKGHIEKGESGESAAVREVFEETGAKVKVLGKVDAVKYFYVLKGAKIFKNVTFFLMESTDGHAGVDKTWAHEIDEVLWVDTGTAREKLTFKDERRVIEKAEGMLKAGIQDKLT